MTQTIDHYLLLEKIHEGRSSYIYTGQDLDDKTKPQVIIKVLKDPFPSSEEMAKLKSEYELTAPLQNENIIKMYELTQEKNKVALIEEDFGGVALSEILKRGKLSLDMCLLYGIKICQALSYLHQVNIIHKDLNPSNIIINEETGELKLIDFSLATSHSNEITTIKNLSKLEGTLAYISPEQTGRMNRLLDYRTDFYSLGVTLYEMLTGKLPFLSSDPLEIIHGHLAKVPTHPQKLDPSIPGVLAEIVLKLLSKSADERYFSADGILYDLEKCKKQEIEPFILGEKDFSAQFVIPQKLYGREEEVKSLLSCFDQVTHGDKQLMMVTGYSGIGKTALVQEIFKPITEKKGIFITGKFNQFLRTIPYFAFTLACKDLIKYILAENANVLEDWRNTIRTTLGADASYLIEVIPELTHLIGRLPVESYREEDPKKRQLILNQTFTKFIKIFSSEEHPLVIFLDDLQWADEASLRFLSQLIGNKEISHLFLIGAYRSNEVTSLDPLAKTLKSIEEHKIQIKTIAVPPLSNEAATSFIADTLHQTPRAVKELAHLIMEKTGGNPFFLIQFLKTLYQEKLLYFEGSSHTWQWSLKAIEEKNITDNVVDLVVQRLVKLPSETQSLLSFAACLGNTFELNTLATVNETSSAETFRSLSPSIQQGDLLLMSGQSLSGESIQESDVVVLNLKFLHDRVQQAALSLVNQEQQTVFHYKIADLLLKQLSKPEIENHLFEIVDHVNQAESLLEGSEHPLYLDLNLRAARKAKLAGAHVAALKYIQKAMQHLSPNDWVENYDKTLAIYKERISLEFLHAHLKEVQEYFKEALNHAKTAQAKAELHLFPIVQLNQHNEYLEALTLGREALRYLDIDLPNVENAGVAVEEENKKFKAQLNDREISSMFNLPPLQDPTIGIAVKILNILGSSALFAHKEIIAKFISLRLLNLSSQYGYSRFLPSIVAAYVCTEVVETFQENSTTKLSKKLIDSAFETTGAALKICEKKQDFLQIVTIKQFFMHDVQTLKVPLKLLIKPLEKIFQDAIANRETFSAMLATIEKGSYIFEVSQNLKNAVTNNEQARLVAKKYGMAMLTNHCNACDLIAKNLMGPPNDCFSFYIDETLNEKSLKNSKSLFEVEWFLIHKAVSFYLYGNLEIALESIQQAKFISTSISAYDYILRLFIESLIGIQLQKREQESHLEILKLVAETCPDNFRHLYLIIQAELARLDGKWIDAVKLYNTAAKTALENDFMLYGALATELQGRMWRDLEVDGLASNCIQQAYFIYKRWGANAKAELMKDQYSTLFSLSLFEKAASSEQTAVTSTNLDFSSLLKASQAISSEIELSKLIRKLLTNIVENIGAQRGVLLLKKDDQLLIEGSYHTEGNRFDHIMNSSPVDANQLPLTILQSVKLSKENVILINAAAETKFQNDPYILSTKPKSLLCYPLVRQDELLGILYFENNLTAGAFTSDRLEILHILASSASISIENARLFSSQQIYASSLMQLTAGISHEINTPAGAIVGAADELEKDYDQLVERLIAILSKLPSELHQKFIEACLFVIKSKEARGTKEEREVAKKLEAFFGERHLEISSNSIRNLAKIGFDVQNIQFVLSLLETPFSESVQNILVMIGTDKLHLQNVTTGIEKIVQLVRTLNIYSHSGKEELGATTIEKDIDATLKFLQNRLKNNVTVVKEFEPVPDLLCYSDQLNIIWLNLINNAVEAMKNQPQKQIIIRIKKLGNDAIQVDIEDNGPGIPENIRPYIFEPYFSTKKKGEGTGLGLWIIKDVINKHKGKIKLSSQPGKTLFEIVLPLDFRN